VLHSIKQIHCRLPPARAPVDSPPTPGNNPPMTARVHIANAPCSWGINYPTGNAVGWRQYLDEVAAAGYRGTELGPFGYFPNDAALLKDELARRNLELVGATHVHAFGDRAALPRLVATLRELCPLLLSLGARHLVVMDEDGFYPRNARGVLDAEGWRGLVAGVREAQSVIENDYGLKASFHPHVGTAVEREAQIDRLLADTEIDLCFDTGHHAFWGQDPILFMRRVFPRIAYMHLKNVDRVVRQRVLAGELTIEAAFAAGVMCPLPDGVVDIREVLAILRERGFSGPTVVEQDLAEHPVESPLELARRNLDYLGRVA
jgi:inosose dehydratase